MPLQLHYTSFLICIIFYVSSFSAFCQNAAQAQTPHKKMCGLSTQMQRFIDEYGTSIDNKKLTNSLIVQMQRSLESMDTLTNTIEFRFFARIFKGRVNQKTKWLPIITELNATLSSYNNDLGFPRDSLRDSIMFHQSLCCNKYQAGYVNYTYNTLMDKITQAHDTTTSKIQDYICCIKDSINTMLYEYINRLNNNMTIQHTKILIAINNNHRQEMYAILQRKYDEFKKANSEFKKVCK